MSKQFWAVIVVIVLVFVGIFVFTGNKNNNKTNSSSTTLTEHVKGSGTTGVTLVEYGDYECPYCGYYYFPVLQKVIQEYSQKIYFQFRNFPLTSAHPNAFAGARAAEAAALQGKFWQMHDKLYEENVAYNQAQLNQQVYNTWINASDPTTYFDEYAQELGLNVSQFKSDFGSTKVDDLITADMNEGNKLGITGTPTFYLDGKQVQIGDNVSAFEKVLNAEIAQKQASHSG